LTKR
ncbi:proline dehydrogenase family protein, partial [Vibrio cholerae O1 str. 116063]|jgi:Ion transport protein